METREKAPDGWPLLSPADRLQYAELAARFRKGGNRYERNQGPAAFASALEDIRAFCMRSDDDDWRRCVVCGAFWDRDRLYVNVHHLSRLLARCKSTINAALASLGYVGGAALNQGDALFRRIPYLASNRGAARQWSWRGAVAGAAPLAAPAPQPDGTNEGIAPCEFGCLCGCDCRPGPPAGSPCVCDLADPALGAQEPSCRCAKVRNLPL
jgi:hypothetical protein